MNTWLDRIDQLPPGERAVSVAVASTRGSTPREAGTRMLVTVERVFGTIGGGHLEFKAIAIARDMLASQAPSALKRFPLGASLGQCCGGLVNLLFEPVSADVPWLNWLRDEGADRVMVTAVQGDAASGKMVVFAERALGSLGDADRDADAIVQARARLGGTNAGIADVRGTACFFETMTSPDFRIVLFGAGHVGRALVGILAGLPCQVTWIDARMQEFPDWDHANVEKVVADAPEDEVAHAHPGSYFLVMTHDHSLDEAIARRILLRDDYAYFGLIGSLSKRRQFERRLAARGISASRLAAMTCPIGADGPRSKEPMAIAVAVASELLKCREARLACPSAHISHSRRA